MLLRAPKLFLLVTIFQVISQEKKQVVAWHHYQTTTIVPSPSFQYASASLQVIAPTSTMQGSPVTSYVYCHYWQFRCNNGQCVNRYNLCDGWRNCYDGSDEWSRNCPRSSQIILPSSPVQSSPVTSYAYCHYWQFRCNNGQCVNRYNLCDGRSHCYDGSDEWSGNCPRSSQIISPSSTASQIISPSSAVPSQASFSISPCYYGQFRCGNGQCIDRSRVCDGRHRDCRDGSDEWHCSSSDNSRKCQNKVDLGFILDSSGSVPRNDFQRMNAFVKDLTNFFTISSDETRISVMTFASHATIHIKFSRLFSDKRSLDYVVNNIGYSGGGTGTAKALNLAYTHMFSRSYGARGTEVKKVVIILTDGQSNNGMVSGPARRLKNSGVVIFSVGIGRHVSMHELHAMASEPTGKHVIRLDNFSQLSTLAEQMSAKTCNASHFFVFCKNHVMSAVFVRADLPKHVNIDHLYLRDRRCKASYNSTHVFINAALTGCGTLYEETEQMMFFTNTLSEKSQKASGAGVITRDYLFNANFTCSYGRKRTVGTFSFEPAQQRLTVNLRSGGNLTFAMDFYKSISFVEPYTIYDYPVFKHLSDFIYIQYSVNTSSADLVVHAETCRATPTNRPYDNPQYVFIANGCDNDSTIQHFNYGMSSVQRFRIQAFRFLTQHRFVYIHCDLVVCNRNYLNSTCARGNTCSHRYRRDVNRMSSSDDSSRMYALSFGPLMYSKETGDDHEKNTGDSNSKSNSVLIGSLIGIACIAVVLASVLVFVMKRRRPVSLTTAAPEVLSMDNVAASAE